MDDFSVVGASFDDCLSNLELVFKLCKESNLSRLEFPDNEASQVHINDSFPDKQLLALFPIDWTLSFTNIVNYLASGIIPLDLTSQQNKSFFVELRHYF